jgi:ribonuclease R
MPEYRPVKPRVIAKQLRLGEDETVELKRVIKRLVKAGQLAWGPKHLIEAVAPRGVVAEAGSAPAKADKLRKPAADRVSGVFRRALGGFGFVRPSSAPRGADRSFDIFIPGPSTRDAASGDTVLVRLRPDRRGRHDKLEGEIVEILERDTHQFVGTYFEQAGRGFVQVDGTVFQQPILVGDPGAKNARLDDKVVFEMVRFPSPRHDGEGVITEVLGPRGTPGVDTLSVIREFGLPEEFADDALAEARVQADRFDEALGDRVDLTGDTIITIDPLDARDFDDAISLVRLENGHWRLGVHIADVSHFVQPKTPLDREAHNRATSVYLPDRVIPMLPEIISNNLASLQPDRVRYTKSCFIEFTAEGITVAADPANTAIQSKRRFTYEEVDDYLSDRESWRAKVTPAVHQLLADMHELAMILRARRMKRGALELSMAEIKIDLDAEGRVRGAHRVLNTVSHQIIEEFMLAANDSIAEFLRAHDLHFLRRIHQAPDPRKMKILTEFVGELGISVERLEDRFELQQLLQQVAGQPQEYAVNYAVLRSLQRAIYGPADEGHYALASECYCHFTSPIRRYPDLTIHRLLDAILKHKKPVNDLGALQLLGEHCSEREQLAEAAERELVKVKLLHYLSSRIGEEWDAVVTGVEEFGLFVQGLEIPGEGLIHVSSLDNDHYRFDRRAHSLVGNLPGNAFRLGDRVRVSVYRVNVERRELDFRLVQRAGRTEKHIELRPANQRQKTEHKKTERKKSNPKGKSPSDRRKPRRN